MVSTSTRGESAKQEGFDSAPRAIITDDAPVVLRTRFASSHPLQSPFSTTAIPFPIPSTKSTISRSLSITALSLSLMLLVRQWTVKALIPVLTIFSTSLRVSSCEGSSRIFAVTVICGGISFRRAVRMEQSRSGLLRRAAPMPACVEKGLGQPQFRSMPDTSWITVLAA